MAKIKTKKNIGIISVRLGGTDGVSLEVDKWTKVLKKMGWQVYFCTGEIMADPSGYNPVSGKDYKELKKATIIKNLSLNQKSIASVTGQILREEKIDKNHILAETKKLSDNIFNNIKAWIDKYHLQKIIVENLNSLPANIPAAIAVGNVLEEYKNLQFIFHHHDFYWERNRYKIRNDLAKKYLKKYFPPSAKNATHVTINSLAQKELLHRNNLNSVIIPNLFDIHSVKKDEYNNDLRRDIGIKNDAIIFLTPVRIVPRKNIEAAIELVKRLNNPKIKLVLAGCPDFVSGNYVDKLKLKAKGIRSQVKFACSFLTPRRRKTEAGKKYTIFDFYAQSDFVIYPTSYEGWGNALGEALVARLPVLTNRYEVFRHDIEPHGFNVMKINNGRVTQQTVKKLKELLDQPDKRKKMTDVNYQLMNRYFSLDILRQKLERII